MSDLKKFIITLHSHEDLEQFYDDMETPGGGAYYPNREVDIAARRPKSRNTHYWLTQEEASLIRIDPRVEDVIPEELITMTRRPSYTQTSTNWNKTFTNTNTHVNWGLLRCVEGVQRNSWGTDITPSQSGTITVNNEGRNVDVLIVDGHITPLHPEYAINSNGTGGSRVVQYDWFQNSLAVEGITKSPYVYEPYVDTGAGTTFVFQNVGFNYSVTGFTDSTFPTLTLFRGRTYTFDFTSVTSSHPVALRLSSGNTAAVPGTTGNNASSGVWGAGATVTYAVPLNAPDSIVYQCAVHSSMIGTINIITDTSSVTRTSDNNHGAHVAGTVAGNTQGWARSSNIYNISPYATNQNPNAANFLYDYIREFHENKPINPLTGRKNPTIMNCSYGSAIEWNQGSFGPITRAVYRGVDTGTVPAGLTTAQLNTNGIYDAASNQQPVVPYYTSADAADIQDLIDLGVIVVAASGNESFYTANSTDQDWNNYFDATFDSINYIWYYHRGCAPAAISNVISVGAVGNTANETKAVFSNNGPGVDIFAPGTAIMSSLNSGGTTDSRNASYRLGKFQGTSMASPQVCGVLACVLETYPNMNQSQAREYIFANSVLNQMTNTGGSYTDTTSLNGATNRYLRYKEERPSTGVVFPKKDYFVRPASGAVYPRTRIRKT